MKKNYFFLSVFMLVFLCGFSQDGSPDLTFGNNGVVETDINNEYDLGTFVTVSNTGIIYVAGQSTNYVSLKIILSYLPDGSLNNSFGSAGVVTDNNFQNDWLKIATHQENLYVLTTNNNGDYIMSKILPSGSIDTAFGSSGFLVVAPANEVATDFIILPDNKILVLGMQVVAGQSNLSLKQYLLDGSVDTSFGNNGLVNILAYTEANIPIKLKLDSNSQNIYISGRFQNIGDTMVNGVVKVNLNGVLDTAYGNNGVAEIPETIDYNCGKIGILNNGSVVTYCNYSDNFNQILESNMHKINPQGIPDLSYGNGGVVDTYGNGGILVQENNRILVYDLGWDFFEGGGLLTLRRFYANGNQDNSFQHTINYNDLFNIDAAFQPDGKILVTGTSAWYNGYTDVVLLRYNNTVLGVQDSGVNTVKLFPNPVINNLIVKGNLTQSTYGIFDITGKQIITGNLDIGETQINVSSLQSGMYVFKTAAGFVQKIVKE